MTVRDKGRRGKGTRRSGTGGNRTGRWRLWAAERLDNKTRATDPLSRVQTPSTAVIAFERHSISELATSSSRVCLRKDVAQRFRSRGQQKGATR